jgi:hypothetical protein
MSQIANTLDRTTNAHFRRRLDASGKEERVDNTGTFFIIAEQDVQGTDFKFQAAFEDGPFFPVTLGLKFKCPAGNSFSYLRFKNETGVPMTVEGYAGNVEVEDMRLNIVRGRPSQLWLQQAPTKILGQTLAGDQIAGTTAVPLLQSRFTAANPEGYSYRKSVLVTNLDPTSSLVIRQAGAGATICAVPAAQVIELETSDDLEVYNPNGSPVSARIGEIFYLL